MARALESKWSELTEKQQNRFGTKADFKAAKKDYQAEQEATRMAGEAVKEYKQSDSDYLDLGKLGVEPKAMSQDTIDRRAERIANLTGVEGKEDKVAKLAAKNAKQSRKLDRQESFDASDINTYDPGAYGGGRFSAKDVAFLESQGFSKQEVSNYANSLDKSKIHGSAQVLDGYDIHRDGMRDADGNFNASQLGVKEDHFNKKDMRGMAAEGLSEREMARTMYDQMDGTTRSKGAQKLLDKYIGEFRTTDTDPDETVEEIETGTDAIEVDNSDNSIITDGGGGNTGGTVGGGNTGGGIGNPGVGDNEQTNDVIGGGDGSSTSIVDNSGNTNINDSFNGGTIDISGDITAGGDVGIDNSNNAVYYGGDSNNSALNSGVTYGDGTEETSQSEQQAQDMLQGTIDSITGGGTSTSLVSDSGNTAIDNSFNGGNVDISGDITAGGNVNIDNSNNSRYYGGDSTNIAINYGEGQNKMNTTPLSDLTMLGYGKPSSSPSAQAQFVDMYQTLNQDAQKKYKDTGVNTAYKYIQNAAATNPIDYVALNQQIAQGIQNHYDRAAVQESIYMGDKYNYKPPTFQMPDPLDPIESDAASIADDYKDELED